MKDDIQKRTPFKNVNILLPALFALAVCALLASCENILDTIPRKDMGGGYEQDVPAEGGSTQAVGADSDTLTVRVRRAGGAARHASPSSVPNFAYAALLYPYGGTSSKLVSGEADGSAVTFLFERPADTTSLVLELFAFAEGTTDFSRTDALLGGQCGVTLRDDEKSITVDAIPLKAIAGKKGFVSLKVTAPADCTLDIDDNAKSLFTLGGTSPDYTIAHKEDDGIPSGSHPITFIVTTESGTTFRVPETVNVYPGMTTDAWYGGAADAPLEIPALADKVFYVRGSGEGWYSAHDELKNIEASDSNAGTYLSPLATIQRAVDTVIAANDGESKYTICIDGDLTLASAEQAGANGMADFSALDKPLSLTIKPLLTDADAKSTLDANSLMRVMCASPATGGSLDLTLKRLVLTGGNASDNGGAIYTSSATLEMSECEVIGNTTRTTRSDDGGGIYAENCPAITMTNCTISGNKTYQNGGGIYVYGGSSNTTMFKMIGGTITENSSSDGGGVALYNATFEMTDGTISKNRASDEGGGIHIAQSAFNMEGGTISENTAADEGGGVFAYTNSEVTLKNCTISYNAAASGAGIHSEGGTVAVNGSAKVMNNSGTGICATGTAGGSAGTTLTMEAGAVVGGNNATDGGGILVNNGSVFTMNGGTIGGSADSDRNTATASGGGVYVGRNGTFTMTGGAISKNNAVAGAGGVYVANNGGFTMTDGTISGNLTDGDGGGVYVESSGTFSMNGGIVGDGNKTGDAGKGGGVFVSDGDFTMSNTAAVKGNMAKYGGGIYIREGSTFAMNGGEVSENHTTASGGGICISSGVANMYGGNIFKNEAGTDGGGIYIVGDTGTFTMTDGTISDNMAYRGGGFCNYGATFIMKGDAKVSGNHITGREGTGAYITDTNSSTGVLKMSGSAQFGADNEVYLRNENNAIQIADILTGTGIVATIEPRDYVVGRQVLSGSTAYLSSPVCARFKVKPNADVQYGIEFKTLLSPVGSAAGVLKVN